MISLKFKCLVTGKPNWSATRRISYSNPVFWDSPFVFAELSPMVYKWRKRTDEVKTRWKLCSGFPIHLCSCFFKYTYFTSNILCNQQLHIFSCNMSSIRSGVNMSLWWSQWSLIFRASEVSNHSRTVWDSSYFSAF